MDRAAGDDFRPGRDGAEDGDVAGLERDRLAGADGVVDQQRGRLGRGAGGGRSVVAPGVVAAGVVAAGAGGGVVAAGRGAGVAGSGMSMGFPACRRREAAAPRAPDRARRGARPPCRLCGCRGWRWPASGPRRPACRWAACRRRRSPGGRSKKFGARSICASSEASQPGSGASGDSTSAMMERPRRRMKGRVSVIVAPNR